MLDKAKLELGASDLGGRSLEEVACRQCGVFCSERQPVFVDGKPRALCSRSQKGREVVARWKKRTSR